MLFYKHLFCFYKVARQECAKNITRVSKQELDGSKDENKI